MDANKLIAALAFAGGAATAAITTNALIKETGVPTYYVNQVAVNASPLPDGGTFLDARVYATVTTTKKDGGTVVSSLDPVMCPLTPGQKSALQPILAAVTTCVKNSP